MPENTENKRVFNQLNKPDFPIDPALRPRIFNDFVGQEKIKEQLHISITAAQMRGDVLDHILFCGPPGLGKTTLAYIIANSMNSAIKTTSGPVIDKPGDLAGLLTSLQDRDVLFIDEIHRLNSVVEEYLYSAMEDGVIDILIDKGPSARSVKLNLPKFTLVGATTRSGLLTAPLRSRFGMMHHLNYYSNEDLTKIILRSANLLKVKIKDSAAYEIGKRSRGTARVANNLLKRVRDFAMVKGFKEVDVNVAEQALSLLDIDSRGLDEIDKKILRVIIENYKGGPVGLNTLAVAVSEESETLEEVYEPFLILAGFLKRTSSGRCVTEAAYHHLGIKTLLSEESSLFK
ncbi:MAG: hypothetical protein ACD_79C00367G0007 [uncultured bacterium]|nr:MAG: hypothetical protein ACD_79C00367G0007 [uncultured bacterium]